MFAKIKSPWYKYLILTIVGILLIIISVATHDAWTTYIYYTDGFLLAGVVLILLGGLSFVTSQGAFDIFSYLGTKRSNNGKKLTLAEYSEVMREERQNKGYVFMPYILVGISFLVVGIIMLCFV